MKDIDNLVNKYITENTTYHVFDVDGSKPKEIDKFNGKFSSKDLILKIYKTKMKIDDGLEYFDQESESMVNNPPREIYISVSNVDYPPTAAVFKSKKELIDAATY